MLRLLINRTEYAEIVTLLHKMPNMDEDLCLKCYISFILSETWFSIV
jgi:hypothetical protein